MRIGDVNKDNYGQYIQMLGLKNSKEIEQSLDNVWGKGKFVDKDFSIEADEKRLVALGYVTDGMLIDGNVDDGSWKKIVTIPDSVIQEIIDVVRETFMTLEDGKVTAERANEEAAIMQKYVMSLPPNERLSAGWTMQKIYQTEAHRIIDYLYSQMPSGWKNGDPIDPDVLARAVSGEHVDVKA